MQMIILRLTKPSSKLNWVDPFALGLAKLLHSDWPSFCTQAGQKCCWTDPFTLKLLYNPWIQLYDTGLVEFLTTVLWSIMIEDSVHIIMNLVKVLTLSLPVTIVVIYFSCLLMLPIVQTIWTQIRLLPWSGFIMFASMKNLALNALEYMQQTQKADNSALFFLFYPLYKQCTSRSYGSVV